MDPNGQARRYAVISGKGGVGKSVITANLAAALSAEGLRTLVVDGDLGLASLDVLLGIKPLCTLHDVLHRDKSVESALLDTQAGFKLLPSGSGLMEGTVLTETASSRFSEILGSLAQSYDAILLDAGAGIGDVVIFLAGLADELFVVATPEPTSVVDAYATIKVIARQLGRRNFNLLVNQVDPADPDRAGAVVARQLQQVVSRFLTSEEEVQIRLAGSIPRDPELARSVNSQRLVWQANPDAPSSRTITRLAGYLAHS
jgi:flagellar biosynthesis protein FlhG